MKKTIELGKKLRNYISIIGKAKKKKINGHTFITDIEVEKIIFCLPKKTEAIKK